MANRSIFVRNNGTDLKLNPSVLDFTTGMNASESSGVTTIRLATGYTPSHIVKFAGSHTTTGGAAAEAFTVTGVASTDVLVACLRTKGGTPRTIITSAPTTNTITVTFSGDPSTDHVVDYVVYRAVS